MKIHDLATIGAAALVTAILTVATFLPASLEAGGDGDGPAAKIAHPKLATNGVEITIALVEDRPLKPGDEPVFELRLVNTTNQPVAAAVRVAMTSMFPGGLISRIGPMPQNLWQDEYTMTLEPGATNVVSVATKTKLPANSTINVVLQSIDPSAATAAPPTSSFRKTYGPSVDANAVTAAPNAPKVQATPWFVLDSSAIVAMSFSTRTPAPEPTVALAK
jgi:hypothetical protein